MVKKTLIITDGTESIHSAALLIEGVLSAYKVKICEIGDFSGTDLLPAEFFFIGCEKPNQQSFSYLEELLTHINLASRKCGIFSTNEKTIKYLNSILKDSEVFVGQPLLIENDCKEAVVKNWVDEILKG